MRVEQDGGLIIRNQIQTVIEVQEAIWNQFETDEAWTNIMGTLDFEAESTDLQSDIAQTSRVSHMLGMILHSLRSL